MYPTISFIVPTTGRYSLRRTLASITLWQGDEVLVIKHDPPSCDYGASERNEGMWKAKGNYLAFIDDDDWYVPGARALMDKAIRESPPDRPIIFRMEYPSGRILWDVPWLYNGRIGTPMLLIPNVKHKLIPWEAYRDCDFRFVNGFGWEHRSFIWRNEIIAQLGKEDERFWSKCQKTPIRVFLKPPPDDHAIKRIHFSLVKNASAFVTLTDRAEDADIIVYHVTGRHDRLVRELEQTVARGQKYILIQYTLRGAQKRDCKFWIEMWHNAVMVWSYVDLKQLCREDGVTPDFHFYHAPLGVDPEVFRYATGQRPFVVATSGRMKMTESVNECLLAARNVNRPIFHIGKANHWGKDVSYSNGESDEQLAAHLAQCEFAVGLRRGEGFELPAAEGLLCGARPIVFDSPHYRQWYDGLAEFIPEGTRAEVIHSLTELFRRGARPVTLAEREKAKARFDWASIASAFWNHADAPIYNRQVQA